MRSRNLFFSPQKLDTRRVMCSTDVAILSSPSTHGVRGTPSLTPFLHGRKPHLRHNSTVQHSTGTKSCDAHPASSAQASLDLARRQPFCTAPLIATGQATQEARACAAARIFDRSSSSIMIEQVIHPSTPRYLRSNPSISPI